MMLQPFTFEPKEVLPPTLSPDSQPPALFDGTIRLYMAYICPYAQRTWIARNYKGLQDQIKLVPIDLDAKPDWYKEKVYPPSMFPSLEHNGKVIGESLDLLKYIDDNFEGPALMPEDPAKRQFSEELLPFCNPFNMVLVNSKGEVTEDVIAAFDKLEEALGKFDDGPFFLGEFSLVDIAFAPFVERFEPFYFVVKNYDVAESRPKLKKWIEELNKIEAFLQTRRDPEELLERTKWRVGLPYKSIKSL